MRHCKSILARPDIASFWSLGYTPAHTQAPTLLGLALPGPRTLPTLPGPPCPARLSLREQHPGPQTGRARPFDA